MKAKDKNEHPEVKDLKNICKVSPKSKDTSAVCNKVQKHLKKETPKN